jgi:hypothetical protein
MRARARARGSARRVRALADIDTSLLHADMPFVLTKWPPKA